MEAATGWDEAKHANVAGQIVGSEIDQDRAGGVCAGRKAQAPEAARRRVATQGINQRGLCAGPSAGGLGARPGYRLRVNGIHDKDSIGVRADMQHAEWKQKETGAALWAAPVIYL